MGFAELSPNQAASELFQHLHTNDNVAITTRFPYDETVLNYKYVLEHNDERQLKVRIKQNSTNDVQDFCFQMLTTKELVGSKMSTFVKWAGFLAPSPNLNVTLTVVDYPHSRNDAIQEYRQQLQQRQQQQNSTNATSTIADHIDPEELGLMIGYNFTNPILRQRIKYKYFKMKE